MVDSFLQESSLKPYNVYHKGEPRPGAATDSALHDKSGLKIEVSNAEFEDLPKQVADAISFLKQNRAELEKLCRLPEVERACLDFGLNKRDVFCQQDTLPAELLYLAGSIGLDIELSQFPAVEDAEEK
jgi:hypothetical protein